VARCLGIAVMATGGLGGVHRGRAAHLDESADLTAALANLDDGCRVRPVKSILDVGATLRAPRHLERPRCRLRDHSSQASIEARSGFALDWSCRCARRRRGVPGAPPFGGSGLLLANPVAADRQLDAALHDGALASALGARQVAAGDGQGCHAGAACGVREVHRRAKRKGQPRPRGGQRAPCGQVATAMSEQAR